MMEAFIKFGERHGLGFEAEDYYIFVFLIVGVLLTIIGLAVLYRMYTKHARSLK